VRVLALSGSLRAASINTAFCRAAARLAPPGTQVIVEGGVSELPLFNPDLEASLPAAVRRFHEAVASADALLIASPEYAHGVSGVLKNALDWLVSIEGVVGKPVAMINTSPRAHHAQDSLAEILRTMSLNLVAGASVSVPLLGYCNTEQSMLDSEQVRSAVARMFGELAATLAARDPQGPSFPLN